MTITPIRGVKDWKAHVGMVEKMSTAQLQSALEGNSLPYFEDQCAEKQFLDELPALGTQEIMNRWISTELHSRENPEHIKAKLV